MKVLFLKRLYFFSFYLREVSAGSVAGQASTFSDREAGCDVVAPDNGKATPSEVDLCTVVGGPSQGDEALTSSKTSC